MESDALDVVWEREGPGANFLGHSRDGIPMMLRNLSHSESGEAGNEFSQWSRIGIPMSSVPRSSFEQDHCVPAAVEGEVPRENENTVENGFVHVAEPKHPDFGVKRRVGYGCFDLDDSVFDKCE